MPITADTPIQISLGTALAGAFAIAGLIFAGSFFILSQVKDDVALTRSDVAELRQVSREDGTARQDSDAALRQSLSDLTLQLQVTTAELSDVTDSVTNLDESIRTIDDKLSASIIRQQEFEKSIVARFDANAFGGMKIPAEWSEKQQEITTTIKAGGDPLAAWYKGLFEPKN